MCKSLSLKADASVLGVYQKPPENLKQKAIDFSQ